VPMTDLAELNRIASRQILMLVEPAQSLAHAGRSYTRVIERPGFGRGLRSPCRSAGRFLLGLAEERSLGRRVAAVLAYLHDDGRPSSAV
jgi:hypothetical protein